MMKKILPFTMTILALSLTACSDNPKKDLDANESKQIVQAKDSVKEKVELVKVISIDATRDIGNGSLSDNGNIKPIEYELVNELKPVVYFAYDQHTVSDKGIEIVKYYADILSESQEEKINLVGHADERGTPEYNLALGEKRAKAVKEVFMLYGVQSSRIEVTSFGEEQPAVDFSNKMAWSKNRRVEIKVK